MVTKIQKWGNSQGLRVSKDVLEKAHITIGDQVDIRVKKYGILIRPVHQVRGKYNLRELVRQMPKGYKPTREVWNKPTGEEVW
ncbi:MAG: transcriptional regulator/antitoxin, MazE [Chlamydiae bacterium]|nr:transcriptional regulator/antitoxin, MazE [Chlamydiota bacterium]MBI3276685.1 transcriptional regulator/antitoxin, MazE [Chlamydiota bacterium]